MGVFLQCDINLGKYVGTVCLSMVTFVWLKKARKAVLCFEASPCCSSLFENLFHSACPWYRYELQWIQEHPPMSLNIPVLVVFRSISRLKDEVDATLEKVTFTDNIMLIVMHNCEPTLRPTKLLRNCEDKRVISFTNILTWNGSIYACSINEEAKHDIKLYLSSKAQSTMD
ncbi:uncharacterized protein LOC125654244 isoform X2 [Ostrea edulis]|uniref:uncharacterized protein LOC125654244 isoform X2 n=1 Tax=Ostrea edulis TaxID=37623 RepID=UPI0024AFE076|nr:uncharacterized protein LOC125654244 isoform X2 [Ostrea edulis]XP_055999329.1 uncharacterized protein LOC125654244 isoform X2 [Ostrea edulis]